jgi:hypothetical protein
VLLVLTACCMHGTNCVLCAALWRIKQLHALRTACLSGSSAWHATHTPHHLIALLA